MDGYSRECGAPEISFINREFGVVVKVSDFQSAALTVLLEDRVRSALNFFS